VSDAGTHAHLDLFPPLSLSPSLPPPWSPRTHRTKKAGRGGWGVGGRRGTRQPPLSGGGRKERGGRRGAPFSARKCSRGSCRRPHLPFPTPSPLPLPPPAGSPQPGDESPRGPVKGDHARGSPLSLSPPSRSFSRAPQFSTHACGGLHARA